MKLLTIIGTRPEAIKMAPVLRALQARPDVTPLLALTGQHPDLIAAPLRFFGIAPPDDLKLGDRDQDPLAFVERAVPALVRLIDRHRPDRIIVQGDTASAMAGAQAAADRGIALAHVEAGLRTYSDLPWPEEPFRRAIDGLANMLLAPTALAADNLRGEGQSGAIHTTGNSGVDALHAVLDQLARDPALRARCDAAVPTGRPFVLATLHRRENIGAGAEALCAALRDIASDRTIDIVLPLHPSPRLNEPMRAALGGVAGVHLLPPQDPAQMVTLMQRSRLILTDSGGIQEEAPTLGKRMLILRDATERPEAVAMGLAALVACRRETIVHAVAAALDRPAVSPSTPNPYGDGQASARIVAALMGEPFSPFLPGADAAAATGPVSA